MLYRCVTLACVALIALATGPVLNDSEEPPEQVVESEPVASFALSELSAVEPPTLDLGAVVRGTEVPVQFEVINDSVAPASLTTIRASCSCTEIDTWPIQLDPGNAGEIAGSFHAPKRSGVVRKSDVSLHSALGLIGAIEISAAIVDPVRSSIAISGDVFVVRLQARDKQPFTVLGTEPAITLRLTSAVGPSAEQVIEFTHQDWIAEGSPKRIVVLLDHALQEYVVLSCAEARSRTPESEASPKRANAQIR